MKNKLAIILTIVSTYVLALIPIFAQTKITDFEIKSPDIIEIGAGSGFEFSVDVKIPKDHHIYIEHLSALTFNIVTEIKTDNKSGFLIAVKSEPKGIKKSDSLILPGNGRDKVAGTYRLALSEIKGRNKSSEIYNVPLVIKTQLCDTKKDVCFRPQEHKATLKVRVVKDKVAVKSKSLAKDKINWVEDDEEAIKLAKSRGQKILVLFTADWCRPCVDLSKDIFSKKEVSDYLNKNFVTLRFKDGEVDKSYFSKYKNEYFPTMYLADTNMKEIANPPWDSPKKFISSISKFAVSATNNSANNDPNKINANPAAPPSPSSISMNLNITGEGSGKLGIGPAGNWVYTEGKETKYEFTENRRDDHYIIMLNNTSSEWLAVPVKGKGKVLVYRNEAWSDYGTVN